MTQDNNTLFNDSFKGLQNRSRSFYCMFKVKLNVCGECLTESDSFLI